MQAAPCVAYSTDMTVRSLFQSKVVLENNRGSPGCPRSAFQSVNRQESKVTRQGSIQPQQQRLMVRGIRLAIDLETGKARREIDRDERKIAAKRLRPLRPVVHANAGGVWLAGMRRLPCIVKIRSAIGKRRQHARILGGKRLAIEVAGDDSRAGFSQPVKGTVRSIRCAGRLRMRMRRRMQVAQDFYLCRPLTPRIVGQVRRRYAARANVAFDHGFYSATLHIGMLRIGRPGQQDPVRLPHRQAR